MLLVNIKGTIVNFRIQQKHSYLSKQPFVDQWCLVCSSTWFSLKKSCDTAFCEATTAWFAALDRCCNPTTRIDLIIDSLPMSSLVHKSLASEDLCYNGLHFSLLAVANASYPVCLLAPREQMCSPGYLKGPFWARFCSIYTCLFT